MRVGGEAKIARGVVESAVDDYVTDTAHRGGRKDYYWLDKVEENVVVIQQDVAKNDGEHYQPDGHAYGDAARRGDDALTVERAETDEDEAMEGHGQGT